LNSQDPPLKGEEMKFGDEFRDPAAARALVKSITELAGDGEYSRVVRLHRETAALVGRQRAVAHG
jgi:hypothetical protein